MTTRNKGRTIQLVLLSLSALPAAADDIAASVQWAQRVELSTPVSGVIDAVNVSAGQTVDAGTVLVKLEETVFRAHLDAARAEFQLQTRLHGEADKELQRSQELYDGAMLSEHELETAHIEADRANAAYEKAKADMAAAEFAWRRSEVRAPYAAVVLRVLAVPGKTVVSSQQAEPLVVVAQRDLAYARAQIDRATALRLKPGQSVNVKFANRTVGGKITDLGLDPGSDGKFTLNVSFNPGTARFISGQAATLQLP